MDLGNDAVKQRQIVASIKDLEDDGFEFDAAEGSLKLIMEKLTEQYKSYFDLESFRVVVEKDKERPCYSHAMIKIRVGKTTEITSAEGDGPVSALDNALRKALSAMYPQIDDMRLVDFKVRVIDGSDGTDAKVRVLIESRDTDNIFPPSGCLKILSRPPGRPCPTVFSTNCPWTTINPHNELTNNYNFTHKGLHHERRKTYHHI